MSTTGVAPPVFTTDVGKVRLLIGDTNATNIAGGEGTYTFFSDDEIDGYLALESNIYRAAGFAVNALATQAADQAQSIKDYDLAVDMRQRAEQFREQAKQLFERAKLVDAEGDEGFQIVATGRSPIYPELAEYQGYPYSYEELILGYGN